MTIYARTFPNAASSRSTERSWRTRPAFPRPGTSCSARSAKRPGPSPGCGGALVHADIETGYRTIDEETAAWLADLMPALLTPGGIAASGLALENPALERLDVPADVPADRYFLYRRR